jgi:hypothetical protein
MYFQRTWKSHVFWASDHFPVILVTGARQVGKTTFLKSISEKDRTYVSLDDPRLVELARTDPVLKVDKYYPK